MDSTGDKFTFSPPSRRSTWSTQRFPNTAELFEEQGSFALTRRSTNLPTVRTGQLKDIPSAQVSPLTPEYSIKEKDCHVEVTLEDSAETAKSRFLEVILDESDSVGDDSFSWYCNFLEIKFGMIWSLHLCECISDSWLRCPSVEWLLCPSKNRQPDLRIVYCLLVTITSIVSIDRNISLSSIVDHLVNKSIFASSKEKSKMNQLVFMILGWLSMLYSPSLSPLQGKLQIMDTEDIAKRARPSRPRVIEQNFNQAYQPFQHLLRVFGDITPSLSTLIYDPPGSRKTREQLVHSYLSYHTLSRICNVKIEWVDTLNSHLDFDESRRILRVFRFPSFCYLLYRSGHEEPLLTHLLTGTSSTSEARLDQISRVKDYIREILLTYRLLFAQDSGSRSAFNSHHRNLCQVSSKKESSIDNDPLLPRICGRKWKTERSYYQNLDADEAPPTIYSPDQDFPCLGSKLLRLQHFSADQNPHNLKRLYWDRRDIRQFYTFWAVLWIGGSTILLAIVQVVAAWLQLEAANEQNRLQAAQLAAMQLNR